MKRSIRANPLFSFFVLSVCLILVSAHRDSCAIDYKDTPNFDCSKVPYLGCMTRESFYNFPHPIEVDFSGEWEIEMCVNDGIESYIQYEG